MECKPTSYQDLLRHFRQAEHATPTPRAAKPEAGGQKLVYRPLHLKQSKHHNK